MDRKIEVLVYLLKSSNCSRARPGARRSPFGAGSLGQRDRSPGDDVSELARRTRIAKSHVSHTVDLLAKRGILEIPATRGSCASTSGSGLWASSAN